MRTDNNKRSPFDNKKFKIYFQFSMIGLCFVVVFAVFYACQRSSDTGKLNYDDVNIIQYQVPADDAPVAVFETDEGTFKAVLYDKEAPKFCKYFIDLVNDGYYDGTHIFAVQKDVYFMGGAKADNGVDTSDTDKNTMDQELSPDLWPFRGSLISYGDKGGSFFNKKVLSGSRILFVNSVDFTDEFNKELDSADANDSLVSAFKEKGGVPNFSQQYTIFGQVYDGMDYYEQICGQDVTDSESLKPSKDITFTKVYMSTYGENKNDEAFSLDSKKSSSSKKTNSYETSDTGSEE